MTLSPTKVFCNVENAAELYIMEKQRADSFKSWPFDSVAACSKHKMAEAGFYFCGNERENDEAACFACGKVLDGWESNDDPWFEHSKHAPQCIFVKYGKPERDLTVEEFLNIFNFVIKHHLNEKLSNAIKTVHRNAEKLRKRFFRSN